MKTITKSSLAEVVRTHMDELGVNESMMLEGSDEAMLDGLIWNVAGECADEIHSLAPVHLLDGVNALASDSEIVLDQEVTREGSVLEFQLSSVLRLVSFKASDSFYVVTEVVAESSPEGRKQLNPHICGSYDSPVLVLLQGADSNESVFRYYSLSNEIVESIEADLEKGDQVDYSDFIEILEVIPRQLGSSSSVVVADNVLLNYYYLVTAKVLTIMGDQRASEYYNLTKFN